MQLVNEVTKLRETHAVLAHGFVSPCCPVTLLQITGADMFALKDAVEKAKRT